MELDMGLRGKTVIITGGSRGIGRATAKMLVRQGAKVAFCGRNEDDLRAAEEQLRAIAAERGGEVYAHRADVSNTEQVNAFVAAAVERLGTPYGLVNNAGRATPGRFDDVTEQDWLDDMQISLLAMFRVCRAVVPHMRWGGEGRIVNVCALAGRQPIPGVIIGSSLRAACMAFTKALSNELAADNILVNAINVGVIWTSLREKGWKNTAPHVPLEEFQKKAAEGVPLGRVGKPEEAAAVIVSLLAPAFSYVTGSTIDVAGGMGKYSF